MKTLLISEQFVAKFKYWRAGQVQTGMRFRSDLFEHIFRFAPQQRHQVFELAERLRKSGQEVVITTSLSDYTIWINLRTSDHSAELDRLDRLSLTNYCDLQQTIFFSTALSA